MTSSRDGLFITFEGGEGAGKSTQTRLLASALEAEGHEVVVTREPGGTETAEHLREVLLNADVPLDPMEQMLLFYAARHNHVNQLILPALQRGAVVLCDRFSDSTRAYQGAAGGIADTVIEDIHRLTLGDFQPELTLLLDLDPVSGAARVASRGEASDRFEGKPDAFHERLREAFLDIARSEPERVELIDAERPEPDIAADILSIVRTRLSRSGAKA